MNKLWDWLRVMPQFLLPQHALSRVCYRLARCAWPPLKNFLIRAFCAWFGVDMSTAEKSEPDAYRHFNEFFTRALKPGARPIAADPDAIVSPVDGRISQIGVLTGGEIVQAKNRAYDLESLLAADQEAVSAFTDGRFVTLYLAPRDYHRMHMPVTGKLLRMTYVPGRLFAVNTHTTRVINRLFARNERVISLFATDLGPLALIMVGALNVGGMETVWAGPVTPAPKRAITTTDYREQQIILQRGQELGRFNMGSTVILLFARNRIEWLSRLCADDPVTMGMALGKKSGS